MHELEELIDHRLQELPVIPQESGILPDDIPACTLTSYETGMRDYVIDSVQERIWAGSTLLMQEC